eukprot:scaffold12236_cov63-Phaeocystis_antarctica.AAC.1
MAETPRSPLIDALASSPCGVTIGSGGRFLQGCTSKRKPSAPEKDRTRERPQVAAETNGMVEWTAGAAAAPNYTSRNQVSGQLQRLDEAGKFTKEATVMAEATVVATKEATEEAVAKTAVAFSATAELINTTMRASTKAAAAMLIRLTRGNEARAAAVLENVMHSSSTSTRVAQEHATRTATLFAEVIRLHVQAAADLVIALMGRSAQSSDMLMSTLIENTPASAYQLLTVIISRGKPATHTLWALAWAGDTHAQQLFVHILRNRAANGMPLLTKMLPHFVPMLRKVGLNPNPSPAPNPNPNPNPNSNPNPNPNQELCVRLKQKNVDGGIKLGLPKRPLYYLRWVHTGRPKPKTEFGRRLQARSLGIILIARVAQIATAALPSYHPYAAGGDHPTRRAAPHNGRRAPHDE